jgi:tRNA-Thr(GGU) m(6)t(6)A37 methyltransferase TsaA
LIEGNERYGAGSYVLFGPHSSHRPRSERGVRLFGFNVLARADDTRSCYAVKPVGVLRSSLKLPEDAPMQGDEGAPDAVLEIDAQFARAAQNIEIGEKIVIVTWLHLAQRDVYAVHPRSDSRLPLTGVFSTRSPDRPNPIGLHPVTVLDINENRLTIGPIEAVDGTPVIDIKPVIDDA